MSSPFEEGRDSNQVAGTGFGAEPDVADEHIVGFSMSAMRGIGNRLGEEDYRD